MKLKTRIIISFFIIILVPIIFTGAALYAFSNYQLKAIEEQYGIENPTYESLANTAQMITNLTRNTFDKLETQAVESPENFENVQYLDSLNTELANKHSFLLVKITEQVTYTGTNDDISDLVENLPVYGNSMEGSIYFVSQVNALVRQVDFILHDGRTGSAFIVTNALQSIPQYSELIKNMIVTVVLILVCTGLGLSLWIYRGIATPLAKLKQATQNIKEGNLEFTLEPDGVDEISELCQDFEEMRKRLKDNAEERIQFDRDNKELISNISHDLKTPITAVKGYVEGIMDGVADTPEKMDRYIRTIYNKANDMDRLINELTFYSKIDTNRIPYTFNKIHISDYFDDCVEDLGLELESKGVKLGYFNYLKEDIVVIADAEQIKRVINNIVSNSLKYMNKPKGIVNIRLEDVGDFVQVEIEDNGKGIAAKDIPNIFDRFYRTDASRNSSRGGSGIGLSIVKKIIEDHGGKVWATSKENTGTAVYFVLRKYQEVPINE
ncbi:MAG: sensor histidine kinase [Lachnospiraceae bacterium]|jgi:signal transduction histidine kinase